MTQTLLLNATWEPLQLISVNRAVVLVLADKAEVLEEGDEPLRSARLEMRTPRVIRLRYFVRVPFKRRIPLTRRNVLERDEHRCAYCRGRATTIDHVRPRSRGGQHRWDNVVAACLPCNGLKDDHLLSELKKGVPGIRRSGWELPFKPYAPEGTVWLVIGLAERRHPEWEPYLASVPA
jgi:5-methylcytosine-specific restriction endonuclease McrA